MSEAVSRAREFAVAAHGDQLYGDKPYAVHLDAVAELLAPNGELAQVIGYLHDVVEDTAVSLDGVRREFGDMVAACVALVTDEPGANRRERKAKTNAKLAAVSGKDVLALVVKAADRLANLRASVSGGSESKLGMYRREQPAFRAAAYRPGLCDELWREMDRILGSELSAEPKTFSNAARFEVLADGTIYARAGVQTNCGGIAGIHVRIMPNPSGEVAFTAAEGGHPHDGGYGLAVPGWVVPAPYREAIYSGARQALDEHGASVGVSFELLDAFVHPVDANTAKFRQAGWSAMHGWLELYFV
jgi:hypothetical protein